MRSLADFLNIEITGLRQTATYYDALRTEYIDESGYAMSQKVAMLVQTLCCQFVSFFIKAYDKLSVDFFT